MSNYCILTINPGSTSTKLAIFDHLKCVASETIQHSSAELARFKTIKAQFPFRLKLVERFLKKSAWIVERFDAIVGMGGASYSLTGGTYLIDQRLADDTLAGISGVQHPANLGPALAKFLADKAGIPAFLVNGPSMDEFQDLARITGK
jgi:butyrate kinase